VTPVPEPVQPVSARVLERARAAYTARAWLEAHEAFSRADDDGALEAEDLEPLAMAKLMLGRDDEAIAVLERAHHRYLERGDMQRAVRAATWIGMNLHFRGATAPANGWLGRARRLLDGQPGDSVEHGYLMIPTVFRHEAAGEFEEAAALAGEAAVVAERFGDRDLLSMSLNAQGTMLVRAGRVGEGFALLDEAMVTATTSELTPFVLGIVYCGVILACQEVFEVGRAREWTRALSTWVEEQPDVVAFTGRCRIHRAEILQLGGSWSDALEEAGRACRRMIDTQNAAAGIAYYRQAELLRLRGEFAAAEESYREASGFGWEPQPGLAQLRLAQGNRDAALASIRRASGEIAEPLKRAALLPAYVEIALAAEEIEEARAASGELEELAARYESAMLAAMVAYSRGAVAVAEGNTPAALAALREAHQTWLDLDAPYEVARTRALLARACAEAGDAEAARLELEAACAIFRRLGAVPDLARVEPRADRDLHGLSGRELEVLRLVAAGKSNREIAGELVISEHTVARHVQNIYRKLDLSSRAAATAFAFEHALV
jgi:ATP/maltotriose-dependent transcriptional regulator MalT